MKIDCNEQNRRKIRRRQQQQQKLSHWAINRAFIAVKCVHEDLWFSPKTWILWCWRKRKQKHDENREMHRFYNGMKEGKVIELGRFGGKKFLFFFFVEKTTLKTGEIRTNKKQPETVNVALCFKNLWLSLSCCAYFLPFFSTIVSTSMALNFEYLFTEYSSTFKWL